jgi:hypothetical protein
MARRFVALIFGFVAISVSGAEWILDLRATQLGGTPPGFRSTASASGKAGEWRVVEEEINSDPASPDARSSVATRRRALAQVSRDATDEHFPMLIFEADEFRDFTLTTRFKTVSGDSEQMAGIAFRIQDERNYYVVRASSLGNTFRFYKFVDGQRTAPIGPEVEVPKDKWHELTIDCVGNQIRCGLNGRELLSVTDNSFAEGKIGFWTKSDSVSYFSETRIVYTPRVKLADQLVAQILQKYPRLLGLKVYAAGGGTPAIRIVASSDSKDIGREGGHMERDVLEHGTVYYGKTESAVVVTLPLRDRNGEPAAAVEVRMRSFPGQTERNAVARAQPIIRHMEKHVRTAKDLIQ